MNITITDSMNRKLFQPVPVDMCVNLPNDTGNNSPEYFVSINNIFPVTGFSRLVIDDYIEPSDIEYFKDMIFGDTSIPDDKLFSVKLQMTNMAFYRNGTVYIPYPTPIEIGEILHIMSDQEKICIASIVPLVDMFTHASSHDCVYTMYEERGYSKFNSIDTYWGIEYILPEYQEKIRRQIPHTERYLFNREALYGETANYLEFIRKKDTALEDFSIFE